MFIVMINEKKLRYKKFCCEDLSLIENYDIAIKSDEIFDCHHRLELNYSMNELKQMNLYYNRPANELIFLSKHDHMSLHHKGKILSNDVKQKIGQSKTGQTHTEETKQKISKSMDGRKQYEMTDEIRQKLSISRKGKISPMKGKHQSEESKEKNRQAHIGKLSPMKGKHHTEESNEKNRQAHLGKPAAIKGKKKVWNDESHTKFHFE